MRTISIGFSSSTKFLPLFCWLIRLVQGTKFSHVYVKNSTKFGIDLVYQASGRQVNFMSDKVFWTKNETVREFKFDVSDQAFDSYMKFALENVGKPYSVLEVAGDFLVILLGLTKNPFADGRQGFVCSELVADILSELSLAKFKKEDIEKAMPKDIWNICLSLQGKAA